MMGRVGNEAAEHAGQLGKKVAGNDTGGAGARQRVLSMLRDALTIIDEELDEGVIGAKLSECIELLAEPQPARRRGSKRTY